MAKDISQLIKEATEAVKGVPEDLRAVAFQKAFDALSGVHNGGGSTGTPPSSRGRRSAGSGGGRKTQQASGDSNRARLDQLDRTAHPEINDNAPGLANALRVLKAAHNELGIDGLSASDIAYILVDKYRCKITRQAVSQALNAAGRLVNRHKNGNSVLFQIMSGGEKYLDELDSGILSEPAKTSKKKSKAAKKSETSTPSSDETSTKKKTTTKAKSNDAKKSIKKKANSPGQKALLLELIEGGFFNKPKTLPQIIDEFKHTYGRTFKPNEMSTPLLRLLRDKVLTRTQNTDNQYEYKNA